MLRYDTYPHRFPQKALNAAQIRESHSEKVDSSRPKISMIDPNPHEKYGEEQET